MTTRIMFIVAALSVFTPSKIASSELKTLDLITSAFKVLKPQIKHAHAKKLAKSIQDVKCNVPWQLLVSIAFTESSFNQDAVNKRTQDYGLTQINSRMIKALKLEKNRLMSDSTYAFKAACTILEHNKTRYEKRRPYWLGVYRSGTQFKKLSIVSNAVEYDSMIRTTAKKIGYDGSKRSNQKVRSIIVSN